ncbi:MAG: sigma 54-interacting transcriptional regulator [Planctomycetes bacterium]|nr:sigma 54-interacting transcriptional regulator [Planctomycetota bacterium]
MPESFELIVERDQIQRVVRVDSDAILVGRGQDCQLRLEDPLASRQHCRIERIGGEVFVIDLDSANGTWIRGERVERQLWGSGEVVRIGSTKLFFSADDVHALSATESTLVRQVSPERRRLQTLLTMSRALEREDKVERMVPTIIDAAIAMSQAERGFVFVLEKKRTTLAMGRNFARESVPSPEKKVSQTLLDRAVRANEPLLIRDAASDGDFAGVASITDLGLRSMLAVPLRFAGEVVGLLVVDHRLQGHAFDQETIDLLSGLASIAGAYLGAALDRRLVASLRRKSMQLQSQLGRRVQAQHAELASLKGLSSSRFTGLVGNSPVMQELEARMERILESDVPVLVFGESGTGKELVARGLHFNGPRADQAFVVVNCGALPDTLLESELFGHAKGAFTGAPRDRSGRFEDASGGTLFLDEVGEMSEAMQARLLRVLQEGEIRRLGSDELRKVDVRVIAATNVDLAEAVDGGRFREDLYYRLRVVQVDCPPLRSREGDIRLLSEHFLDVEAVEQGRLRRELSDEAAQLLDSAVWPGNVRQLRNEVRRLTLMGEGTVTVDEVASEICDAEINTSTADDESLSLPDRIAALEIRAIRAALIQHRENRSQAAKSLGISRFALLRKLEKYGVVGGES